jgi:TolB-like protein/tetratricopeptide (TPR) repeat protein
MSDIEPRSDFGRFLSEMRRRHVVRFAITYAAAAFVLLQLAEIVFPAFGIGEGGLRLLVAGLTLAFLPAVVLAWIYDITKEGIRRTEEGPGRRTPYRVALAVFALTTVGLTGAVGWYLYSQGFFEDTPASSVTALGHDPAQPIRSLVVLPLQDNSPSGDQGYIASAMHDEIIAQLGTIEGVRVVSRTTSMRYQTATLTVPEIGAELGVDVVVEGSVLRSGEQIRVTLQIIHAATDSSIATFQVDGTVDDLLGLQEDAAQRVATVIGSTYGRGELGRTAQDIPRAAQEAYYQAMFEMDRRTPEATGRALELFGEAVRLAPSFAEAVAGQASARLREAMRAEPDQRAERIARAERDAERAFALDSTSMAVREVYNVIRVARARASGRGGVGRPAADSVSIGVGALDLIWLATTTTLGQQTRDELRDSTLTGPEAAAQLTFEARVMMSRGGFAEAAALLDSVLTQYPQSQEAWDQLMRARVALEQVDGAVDVVAGWNAAGAPGAPGAASLTTLRQSVARDGALGYWEWRRDYLLGQQQAGNPIVHADLAAAYAAVGDRARAYEQLDEALAAEPPELRIYAIPADPVWDPLRREPRFQRIEAEIQRRRVELSLTVGAPSN